MSRLASSEEIKRSYRRLVSRYHPDVNPDPNAHLVLIEINEAYEVLSDTSMKWMYDQRLSDGVQQPIDIRIPKEETPHVDPRRARRGKKETQEEKRHKQEYARARNIAFNKRMKILSFISLILGGLIFIDHYLPTRTVYQKAYTSFKPEDAVPNVAVALFLTTGRKLDMYPVAYNNEATAQLNGEAIFNNTPILGIHNTIQVGRVVFEPINSLHDTMLLYGIVCLASLYVLSYKPEHSLVLPTILTFFSNMLVLSFFILWISE